MNWSTFTFTISALYGAYYTGLILWQLYARRKAASDRASTTTYTLHQATVLSQSEDSQAH